MMKVRTIRIYTHSQNQSPGNKIISKHKIGEDFSNLHSIKEAWAAKDSPNTNIMNGAAMMEDSQKVVFLEALISHKE